MRILGVETKYINPVNPNKLRTSAVDWYRLISPLRNLRKTVDWKIDIQKGIVPNNKEISQMETDEIWQRVANNYDIVYSSYHPNPIAYSYLAVLYKKYGLKYCFDLDDNIFAIKEYNPVYEHVKEKEKEYNRIIKGTPYMTTTNGELKKVLKNYRNRKDDFIKVLPNYIDLEVYNCPQHIEDDVITIVYAGGHTHAGDVLFSEFHTAMSYLLGKYGNKIRFEIVGFIPNTFFNELPNVNYVYGQSDFMDWIELYKKLSPYWDIGVAPLQDDDFNICKSPIKVMEYGAAHAVSIASPVGPYKSIINDGKNGFFAKTVKDWIKTLEILIENKDQRLKMSQIIYDEVKTKWNIVNHTKEWKELFENIALDKIDRSDTM